MKTFIAVMVVLCCTSLSVAQDTTQTGFRSMGPVATPLPVLSITPNAREITGLFLDIGKNLNLVEAEEVVAQKGDTAVPALSDMIFSDTLWNSLASVDTGEGKATFFEGKLYAIYTLMKIGTPQAFQVLLNAADSCRFAPARAAALNAITNTYHNRATKGTLTPDSRVIGILIKSSTDHTYIWFLHKTIGEVAYEGLMQWLGTDFGEPQFRKARIAAGGSNGELSPSAYRDYWWHENASLLVWNRSTGHFETK